MSRGGEARGAWLGSHGGEPRLLSLLGRPPTCLGRFGRFRGMGGNKIDGRVGIWMYLVKVCDE